MPKGFTCTDDHITNEMGTALPSMLFLDQVPPCIFEGALAILQVQDSEGYSPILLDKEMLIQIRDWINEVLNNAQTATV